MRKIGLGAAIFAVCMMGWGILSLIYHDFAMNWQPVPAGIPDRAALAYLSGAMLLAGGAALFWRRSAAFGAGLLAANLLVWIVLLQVPQVIAGFRHEGAWLGLGETLVLFSGAWILFCARISSPRAALGIRIGKYLFAVALIPIGLSHMVYADVTAGMVPGWLPFHMPFAWLTGAAHIAAGVAIIAGVLPQLAALLEAVMMSLFTLLIWLPGIVAAPMDRFHWTAFFASAAISGAAWVVSDTLRRE